ncbi:hypothetical protein [Pseudonocardia pini]|uniref:hypothetical protein n=1 Tax=Pseudonocardia pini TaxID=2758030 RepID=UPI0015EFDFBB|nr:hypothetical protein [Pseudonocardia pini]
MFGVDDEAVPLRALGILAEWAGFLAVLAFVAVLVRGPLVHWVKRRLVELAGPAIIRTMAPRDVLATLLPAIYGDRASHEDVLTGVLGGAGRDARGRDIAVSKGTTAHLRLMAVDERTCVSEFTWTHEFSGVRDNHFLILFGTVDPEIVPLVLANRTYPLFEVWHLRNEDELDDFVPMLRDSLKVGIAYRDSDGNVIEVEPAAHVGEEIALRHFDGFLRLPERIDRKDLRILQLDLYDLADPDHVVAAVERLSVRASQHTDLSRGYITWSPPHPCYLETVTFDVQHLGVDGREYDFLVLPSVMRRGGMPHYPHWMRIDDVITVEVRSWMLPGHAVTLLWRLVDDPENDRGRP